MQYVEINGMVYLVPDKQIDKIEKRLEAIIRAKGEEAIFKARDDYNGYINEIKSDKKPLGSFYKTYNYI